MLNIEMSIKKLLKHSSTVNRANVWIKAYMQERQASLSLAHYRADADKGVLRILEGDELTAALRQRLAVRGIYPAPKPKGALHIFLAYGLNNWESVLPLTLSPFGRVTTFSWQSGGFFDNYIDWLKWRNDLNANMLDAFKKAYSEQPVDVMVGYLSDFNTKKETLIEIGKSGVVIFNMCWDDKLYFNGSPVKGQLCSLKGIVSAVNLNLTNALDSCIKYLVEGGLSLFWPEAAHPDVHKPYNVPFEFDVSFIGQRYGWRPRFIEKLKKIGINVACFGKGWENGPLSDEEMVKLYSRSRINLGFAGVGHSKKLMCLKGRDFEVPMSGGLYLTQDNPELSLVYEVGREILTFKDEHDCMKKIQWLLANPAEADKIRKTGYKRALRDHTWEKRFRDIFTMAGVLLEAAA
mgnify:CR=1 FL=1